MKMADDLPDDEINPLPFRRERNLSNRNFSKRYAPSFRPTFRVTGVDHQRSKTVLNSKARASNNTKSGDMISSSTPALEQVQEEEQQKDLLTQRLELIDDASENDPTHQRTLSSSSSSSIGSSSSTQKDPAWLDVKQKVLKFEKNYSPIAPKPIKSFSIKNRAAATELSVPLLSNDNSPSDSNSVIADSLISPSLFKKQGDSAADEGVEAQEAVTTDEEVGRIEIFKRSLSVAVKNFCQDTDRFTSDNLDDYSIEPANNLTQTNSQSVEELHESKSPSIAQKLRKRSFTRNFRSNPRPKTEIIGLTTASFAEFEKYHTLHKAGGNRIIENSNNGDAEKISRKECSSENVDDEEEGEDQIQLRDKGFKSIQPILDELIRTEQTYVNNLCLGIRNYGDIFDRADLPRGLRGKRYVLLGNIEQIVEFHRDEFLPMLLRNRNDLKSIFDEFKQFIMDNCFYGYVLFTMNKQRSLKLCDVYKDYFKVIQSEFGDKLGINSFLVQPIQRMARYPLLLHQFINNLFKNCDYGMKPIIESCCRLEKRLRNLLITINESEIVNDIVCLNDNTEFNTFYQGKFRKVSEFQVFDHTLKRHYRSKVFIFDKCILYTEIKGKQLIFHGRYPCEHIGIVAKTKSFTLYYEQRKQQECDFMGDSNLVESWLELMRDMITAYAREERKKMIALKFSPLEGSLDGVGLSENSSKQQEYLDRPGILKGGTQPTTNLSLFRDSNRFSADSGIGNIWVMPKPEQDEVTENSSTESVIAAADIPSPPTNTRTTWYMKT